MSRYIDADALIEQLKSSSAYNDYEWAMYADGFIEDIENAPSIDIEPKRGKWIPVKASIHPYGNDVKCSVCGHRMGSSFGYNFCPNCGADMREREGER